MLIKAWFVPVILFATDMIIFAVTPLLAILIRFEGMPESQLIASAISQLPFIVTIRLLCFIGFRLYRRLWRYASLPELVAIVSAVSLGTVLIFAWQMLFSQRFPNSVALISWLLICIFVGMSRLSLRMLSYLRHRQQSCSVQVLIIGAGDAGAMIARELQQAYKGQKTLVGFVDDDPGKQQQSLFGVKVLGTRADIRAIVNHHRVQEIIIALPSAGGSIVRDILQECRSAGCQVKIVPGLYELIDGKISVSELRNIDLEDLLRREPVRLDLKSIAGYLAGKKILVTGAGGSIGSELCRQVAQLRPERLLLLDKDENSIYDIHQELQLDYPHIAMETIIANIRDESRIQGIFAQWRPQVVFHAAAHKHVPLMELQPVEAVRNNIFGTLTVAQAAAKYAVEQFVLVSTDKAVNPTSVMGATKRVAELVIQGFNRDMKTRFCAVRFGNVLGSRGSVIPLFKKQIAAGGPITVTHPDMVRYFMTIPEAVQLILQAGALTEGGEVFVLDMGQPVRIQDLARDLIELSGLTPDKDIAIQYSGIRPGEKLFEELLTAEEGTRATKHEKILTANISRRVSKDTLEKTLEELEFETNPIKVLKNLQQLVPTYTTTLSATVAITKSENTTENEMERKYHVASVAM